MEKYRVDHMATRAYKDIYNAPCSCKYCENFRKAFGKTFPEANRLLEEDFGVDLHYALEIMDNGPKSNKISYTGIFSIKGDLNEDAITIHSEDGCRINLYKYNSEKLIYNNTGMKKPYFFLEVEALLPWVLSEKYEE